VNIGRQGAGDRKELTSLRKERSRWDHPRVGFWTISLKSECQSAAMSRDRSGIPSTNQIAFILPCGLQHDDSGRATMGAVFGRL
jgi:hypothetical protein